MARANPLWKEFDGQRVLAIFQGPHSYVSLPGIKLPRGSHVELYFRSLLWQRKPLSVDELRIVMEALVHKFEPTLQAQKEIMPRTFIEGKLKGIIDSKLKLRSFRPKKSFGQHRSQADQRGTLQGLINSQSSESVALADYMLKVKKGIGA